MKSLSGIVILAVFAAFFSMSSIMAMAADIYTEKYIIHLDGEIRRGDAERVANEIMEAKFIGKIKISSIGGDLDEAMRIATFVKHLHWDVNVAKGKLCASACFFVFIAGEWRYASSDGVNDDGTLKPQATRDRSSGVVGIHRPYFKDLAGNPEAPKKQEEMMRKVKGLLATNDIPQYLIDEMMAHPSNDIYWLRERDLEAIGEYSAGVEETLIAKCGYKRLTKILVENWSEEKQDRLNNCVFDVLGEKKLPIYIDYRSKLKTGWRPWKK